MVTQRIAGMDPCPYTFDRDLGRIVAENCCGADQHPLIDRTSHSYVAHENVSSASEPDVIRIMGGDPVTADCRAFTTFSVPDRLIGIMSYPSRSCN